MKIWITGANGLVGKALQKLCLQEHLAYLATGHEVDISSLSQVKQFFNSNPAITHIVNCAAYTSVDDAEKEPQVAYLSNTLGPENLGKLAHLAGIKLVHLSTDYVFDSEAPIPHSEMSILKPVNVYAATKKDGEERLLAEFPHACIIRTSWVFGNGGKNFISSLLAKLQSNVKIAVVADQINRLTYAPDLAAAIINLLCHEGIYHFANTGLASRYDVAEKMIEYLKDKAVCREVEKVLAVQFPTTASRPRYSILDTQKYENLIGITPRPWQNALQEYIDEYHS